jgi:hypothetical protein
MPRPISCGSSIRKQQSSIAMTGPSANPCRSTLAEHAAVRQQQHSARRRAAEVLGVACLVDGPDVAGEDELAGRGAARDRIAEADHALDALARQAPSSEPGTSSPGDVQVFDCDE